MHLRLEGTKEYKGFQLQSPVTLNESILVLTGKNGSGKTRLLESMQNNSTAVHLNNLLIEKRDIRLVPHSSLNPEFGANYNDDQYHNKVTKTLHLYDQIKSHLELPYNQKTNQNYRGREEGGLDYESLFKLCLSIAKKQEKLHQNCHMKILFFILKNPLKTFSEFRVYQPLLTSI